MNEKEMITAILQMVNEMDKEFEPKLVHLAYLPTENKAVAYVLVNGAEIKIEVEKVK